VKVFFFTSDGPDQVEFITKDTQTTNGGTVDDDFAVNEDNVVLVTYEGQPGSAYKVSVTGDPLCDATIVRHNPKCESGKRCIGNPFTKDGVCISATEPPDHCATSKTGDDECADGSFCKFDQNVEDEDDGPDGVCTPCNAAGATGSGGKPLGC
jgi:hypothetical protein